MMDYFHTGQMENNLPIYNVTTYTYALSAIPIASMIGSIMAGYARKFKSTIKET